MHSSNSTCVSESSQKILDPELYTAKVSPLQSVKRFVSEKLPELGWGKTEDKEWVLDVGCGPGGTTVQLIVPLFPRVEKIVAIDLFPNMVEFARMRNSHPLVEYSVANIEDWCAIHQWEGKISKLVALHSVQWLKNKRKGFNLMFKLLKSGGEAAFCFVLETPFYTAVLEMQNNSKWRQYFQDIDNYVSDGHIHKYKGSHYLKILEEIGFDILYWEEDVKTDVFPSDEEYRNFFTSICALTSHVPSHLKEDFKDDLFQEMLKLNGRNGEGLPFHRGSMMEIVVKKK